MTCHEPGDINWLIEEHFRYIGHWTKPDAKLQRLIALERVRGIYAFVTNCRIRYKCKASSLRHRVRQYNRSFDPYDKRKRRKVHCKILQAWTDDTVIHVWVYDFNQDSDGSLGELETKLINCRKPDWNG